MAEISEVRKQVYHLDRELKRMDENSPDYKAKQSELNNAKTLLFDNEFKGICDVNNDGKITGEELAVFEQMKNSYKPSRGVESDSYWDDITVGGTIMRSTDIKSIEKNGDSYCVKSKNGISVEYSSQQNKEGETAAIIAGYGQGVRVYNFHNGGVKLTGTDKDDFFEVSNSEFTSVDGKGGHDIVGLWDATGVSNSADGRAPIKAEEISSFEYSKNFVVEGSEGKVIDRGKDLFELKDQKYEDFIHEEVAENHKKGRAASTNYEIK